MFSTAALRCSHLPGNRSCSHRGAEGAACTGEFQQRRLEGKGGAPEGTPKGCCFHHADLAVGPAGHAAAQCRAAIGCGRHGWQRERSCREARRQQQAPRLQRQKRRPPWNQCENALARPSHTLLPCAAADKTRRTRRDGALSLLVHLLERGAPRCSTLASFKLNLRFRGLPGGGPRISSPLFKVGTYFILMAGGCMKYTWNIHGAYNCRS